MAKAPEPDTLLQAPASADDAQALVAKVLPLLGPLGQDLRVDSLLAFGRTSHLHAVSSPHFPAQSLLLKVVPPLLVVRPSFARFLRALPVVSRLDSPHIARVYAYAYADAPNSLAAVLTERIAGESLQQYLAHRPPLSVEDAIALCQQIAAGLRDAHSAGLVHGDLSPKNVFVCPREGQTPLIKIVDFGLSYPFPHRQGGPRFGTPGTMAPEQARGGEPDQRSDQFALGCLFYQMLARRPAFLRDGDSDEDVLRRVTQEDPRSFQTKPHIERVLKRVFSKFPTARFSSINDFSLALNPPPPEGNDSVAKPPTSPLPWLVLPAMLLSVLATYFVLRGSPASKTAEKRPPSVQAAESKSTESKSTEPKSTEPKPSKPEPSKPEPSRPEPTKPTKPEPSQPEPKPKSTPSTLPHGRSSKPVTAGISFPYQWTASYSKVPGSDERILLTACLKKFGYPAPTLQSQGQKLRWGAAQSPSGYSQQDQRDLHQCLVAFSGYQSVQVEAN